MHSNHRFRILALSLSAAFSIPAFAGGEIPDSAYQDLHWRLVGPLRGGWATAATGVPEHPERFYFGAADGGVWKSTDAGRTWTPSFQHEGVASIGALVVAPSDSEVLYAGTGQVSTRWDVAGGDGVYRSSDGGATWEHRGLPESEHIGRLWVDPRDANVVLAAALDPERRIPGSDQGAVVIRPRRIWRSTATGSTTSRRTCAPARAGVRVLDRRRPGRRHARTAAGDFRPARTLHGAPRGGGGRPAAR